MIANFVNTEPPRLRGLDVPSPLEPAPSRRKKAADKDEAKGKPSSQGRFLCVNNFVDFALAELTRAEIAVWMILWRDSKAGAASTSQRDMARRAGCDLSTVFRTIQTLKKKGLVKVVRRGGWKAGTSRYQVVALISGN